MSLEIPPFDAAGTLVGIRRVVAGDCDEFVNLARGSLEFLRPWSDPPASRERFENWFLSRQAATEHSVLVCQVKSGRMVGVINMSCIVRGFFQSAYLGYWIGGAFARRGYMTEGMGLLIRCAFEEMKLHRLEANIQPGNEPSIALVRRCGFKKEGFSPKYLKVGGEWRDHERWAVLGE